MRPVFRIFTVILLFHYLYADSNDSAKEYIVSTAEEFQRLFEKPVDSISVILQPGEYHLSPIELVDSTCGNCKDPHIQTNITAGLVLSGGWIKISGPSDRSAVIHTNAGYGIFIYKCETAIIKNLSITGGKRNPDGNATDAAIVVKKSEAHIYNNRIFDNIGDSKIVSDVIVGIIGIAGRENARLFIEDNDIIRNSWDGIALYRGAEATIERNYIDGMDKATGEIIGGGRGVGIGITWDAKAIVRNNLVTRYWKGIGVFVDADAELIDNFVEDIITWGIALWSAGDGKTGAIVDGNVIYRTGACGMSISLSSYSIGGTFRENIIVESGQNSRYDDPEYYCAQTALAIRYLPETFTIENNLFFNNRRASEALPDYDLPDVYFFERLVLHCEKLRHHHFTDRSLFIEHFCR